MALGNIIDMAGQKFNRLAVLSFEGINSNYRAVWLCQCDCGNQKIVEGKKLRSGHTKSCGCYKKEVDHARFLTHGMTDSPEFSVWMNMRSRCFDPKNQDYRNYGGRGITVCERWKKFENFFADVGPRPDPSLTLDRPDNDGNYGPDNWRWADIITQANNRRPRTICRKGHPLVGDNVKLLGKGQVRVCSICIHAAWKINNAKAYARRKEAA